MYSTWQDHVERCPNFGCMLLNYIFTHLNLLGTWVPTLETLEICWVPWYLGTRYGFSKLHSHMCVYNYCGMCVTYCGNISNIHDHHDEYGKCTTTGSHRASSSA